MLIVFRAITGIAVALTTPSSMAMIVRTFPSPKEQSIALGIYGATASIGDSSAFLVGGAIIEKASWRWAFYAIAMGAIPFSVIAFFVLPKAVTHKKPKEHIDLLGISILTAAMILFVYGISNGSDRGWGSPQIIVTLVMSVVMLAIFIVVERVTKDPAIPLRLWHIKNFTPIFFYSLRCVLLAAHRANIHIS